MEKIALITGAAGGLGQALANKLGAEGWRLIVVSREAARLKAVFGEAHLQIEADCSTPPGVRQMFAAIKASQMQPTALAHCVGNIRLGALHRMVEADFNDCLSANLVSAFHTLAGFVSGLREARCSGVAATYAGAGIRVNAVAPGIGDPAKLAELMAWLLSERAARVDIRALFLQHASR